MEGIQTVKGWWPWPWPWIRPYGIPSCITHRPLPIYQISLKSKKLFVDGRTDVRTDIFPPLILLGRLLEVDLISKKQDRYIKSTFFDFSDQCWSEIITVLSPQPCYNYLSVSTVKFTICTVIPVDSTSGDFLGVTTLVMFHTMLKPDAFMVNIEINNNKILSWISELIKFLL